MNGLTLPPGLLQALMAGNSQSPPPRSAMFGRGMPGIIGGYGGGTFDQDERQVTPSAMASDDGQQREPMSEPTVSPAMPMAPPRSAIFGRGMPTSEKSPGASAAAPGSEGSAPQSPLGGSMVAPFDYKAVTKQLLPSDPQPTLWQKITNGLGGVGAALRDDPAAFSNWQRMEHEDQTAKASRTNAALEAVARFQHQDWARQNEADLRASAPFTIGRDRLQLDPRTGQTSNVYHGAADFENYAAAQGLQPGTPEYNNAAQDYVLRGNGPTALANDQQLDDYRTGNRSKLENQRQGNRVGLEGIRQGHRSQMEGIRQDNRITTRQTPTYHDTHPSAPRGAAARPTATDAHGNRVEFDGKNWVPVK